MTTILDAPVSANTNHAGLLRRLAAGIYDTLLVVALFVVPTTAAMLFRGGEPVPPGSHLYQVLLLATASTFFIGFWMHGGQTLGMRAWRLRVEDTTGKSLTLRRGLVRFIVAIPSIAIFGLGILWLLVDPHQQTLPDRVAGTRVIVVARAGKKPGAGN